MNILEKKNLLIIAEMANSHEGNFEFAKKIIFAVAKTGADAIKFQRFYPDELAEPSHENFKLYQKLQMKQSEWKKLVQYSKKLKLSVFFDVFGKKSASKVLELGIDGVKIHSADVSNPHLLDFLSKKNIPILVSAAGCTEFEITKAISILNETKKSIVLMHGYQGYPTQINDLNLNRIEFLKKKFGLPIGLMDHVSGNSEMAQIIPIIGISKGASVIEKHITLDREKKGLDYYSALTPDEFTEMVKMLKKTLTSLGKSKIIFSKNELDYRNIHKKNPIAKKTISKGKKLEKTLLDFKRTKDKNLISFYDINGTITRQKIGKNKKINSNMLYESKPKIAAVIACRVDSSRLYAKPLQLIDKFIILELLIEQIKKSSLIDDIVLAISENVGNDPFIEFAKSHNLSYVIGNDRDVLKRLILGAKAVHAKIIFRITSENPYIFWEGIDSLINNHLSGKYDLSFYNPLPLGTFYEIINLTSLELSHVKGSKRHRSELCTLYINEHQKKFKINQVLPSKDVQRPEIRLTVDSPQDLWVARLIYSSLGKNKFPFNLNKIIKFLDKNPSIKKINSDIPIGVSRIWN